MTISGTFDCAADVQSDTGVAVHVGSELTKRRSSFGMVPRRRNRRETGKIETGDGGDISTVAVEQGSPRTGIVLSPSTSA